MKLTTVLFLIGTINASRVKSFLTKSEMCSYQNCNSCDIVLKNTHTSKNLDGPSHNAKISCEVTTVAKNSCFAML